MLRPALFLGLGCLLFFLVGEFTVRASLPLLRAHSPAYHFRQHIELLTEPDKRLIWKGKPGARAAISNPEGTLVEYALNSLGWRGPEPGPGPKVLVLGDSFSFGAGVAAEERYFHHLGLPGLEFAGPAMMGYGFDQQYLLAKEWLGKQPWQGLLLQLSNNDLLDVMSHRWLDGNGKETESLPEQLSPVAAQFSTGSELFGLFQHVTGLLQRGRATEAEKEKGLARLGLALRAILALAEERKIPVVMVMATDWGEPVYGKELAGRYQQLVAGIARESKVPLLAVHQGLALKDLLPFPDLHWRPETHGIVAGRLQKSAAILWGR